ncbi:hypothetical protein C5F63_10185 [Photobacterium damselae subsp. damselae]|uniref:DUF1778 domain-containing protein n=1 Tax=Photobacterium damselae subsp. damselae TaxID=85581 RepID=A0AAD3ZW92_PHODD|nr:DUF1778 domain-containing protein [Photobacterium damselae]KAB1183805.1 DUF1778 domain-containing protein [Photobacterium damselae subsp. damselae]MCG9703842.1 DUF1778 domain-containing protein [Photobacterium damselae]PSB77563.1 hypothetical protein C5F62_20155 [Photobacterium damselae subsp. damselae]PSB87344.1 hypothetical protein C5F63_10185 [Photobacterium damselae subsp. damselae]TGZ36644.1 hypothetical protein EQ875_00428 [Photobacterium damselae subsp. damselae]
MSALKKERIEVRASTIAKQKIEQAAALAGKTVSSFVFDSALERAEETIRDFQRSRICDEQWDEVMAALENPPEPTPLMLEMIGMSLESEWTVQRKAK